MRFYDKYANKILQNLCKKGVFKAIIYIGLKKKGKRRKETPTICNNKADNYNKTDKGLIIKQIILAKTIIIT